MAGGLLYQDKVFDKGRNRLCEQLSPALIGIADHISELYFLQVHKAAQRGKDVVQYGHATTHLEALDVADLLEQAVVELNLPVLVMHRLKLLALMRCLGILIGWTNNIMAQLGF